MSKRVLILMCSIFLVVPLLFMGCSGDDGAPGATGATGAPGAPGDNGTTGPVTNTDESCMVCHSTARIADISDSVTFEVVGPPTVGVHFNANYEKPDATIDNIIVSNAGGFPKVSFRVRKTTDNAAITSHPVGYPRFMIANLVPATPAAPVDNWSTSLWSTWASERATKSSSTDNSDIGVWDNSAAASGNYTYTFKTPFDNATINSPRFDNTQIQRLVVRTSSVAVANNAVGQAINNAVGVVDFNLPIADNTNAVLLTYNANQRVTVDACKKCHGPLLAGAAHGGSYVDTKVCVLCHTPIGNLEGPEMVGNGAWAINFFHKIHAAIAMPEWATRIGGKGYGAVTYPQDIRDCVVCHTASGKDLGLGNKIDNWKNLPTAAACGSCHEGFPLTSNKGGPHGGGTSQPDSNCASCHPPSGPATTVVFPVATVHNTSPDNTSFNANPKNVPEFNVTMTLSPVKAFYVAGDNVTVTATLRKHSDNTAVAGSVYTSARDNTAGIAGGGLRVASVYVYGPRALPKPIIKVNGVATQAVNMFVSTTDNNVATDNTGFKYKVTIPSGLANGTYMVRTRFGDYSRVNDNNYVVESIAFQTFQIGNATVTNKVAGDACVNCHGNGSAPFHDARHIVVWNTDECNACHDFSGGHADVLNNRVHAVHAASKTGDAVEGGPIDWSDVTYPLGLGWPGGIGRCDICHTSGNTSYRSNVKQVTCYGCHADRPGAVAHMVQMGGDFGVPEAPDITP